MHKKRAPCPPSFFIGYQSVPYLHYFHGLIKDIGEDIWHSAPNNPTVRQARYANLFPRLLRTRVGSAWQYLTILRNTVLLSLHLNKTRYKMDLQKYRCACMECTSSRIIWFAKKGTTSAKITSACTESCSRRVSLSSKEGTASSAKGPLMHTEMNPKDSYHTCKDKNKNWDVAQFNKQDLSLQSTFRLATFAILGSWLQLAVSKRTNRNPLFPGWRAYACQCRCHSTVTLTSTSDKRLPWTCLRH